MKQNACSMKTHSGKWRNCCAAAGLLLILSVSGTSTASGQSSEEKELVTRLIDRSIELDYLKTGYEQLKKETEYVRLENDELRKKVQFQQVQAESAAQSVSTAKKAAFWRGFRWGAGSSLAIITIIIFL